MKKLTIILLITTFLSVTTLIAGEIHVPITSSALIESPDTSFGMKNFLIKFDIPDRVIGKNIDLASLFIPFNTISVTTGDLKLPLHFDARPVSISWSEVSASWSTIWRDSTGAFISDAYYGGDIIEEPPMENTLFIDITRIVQKWADGYYGNNGLCLIPMKNVTSRINSISVDAERHFGVIKIFYSNKLE